MATEEWLLYIRCLIPFSFYFSLKSFDESQPSILNRVAGSHLLQRAWLRVRASSPSTSRWPGPADSRHANSASSCHIRASPPLCDPTAIHHRSQPAAAHRLAPPPRHPPPLSSQPTFSKIFSKPVVGLPKPKSTHIL